MIFKHISREKGLWRGWLKDGQTVEISTATSGWAFEAGVHIHEDEDEDGYGRRLLFFRFWRITVILPLGIVSHPWPIFEAPSWSVSASSTFGLVFEWGKKRRSFDWPWTTISLAYEEQLPDGSWQDVFAKWRDEDAKEAFSEMYPYTYVLGSGEVQERTATISKRRHVKCYRALKMIGWPRWVTESIDVEFSDEVGERTGTWKGGCVGCGYDLLPGEEMVDALRRMERERKFT